MKFVVIGDLHGQMPELYFQSYDAILCVGDFCSSEARKYMFEAIDKDVEWYDLCGKKKAREYVKKSLESGRKVLEYLDSLDVPVYVVPGNADWIYADDEWKFLDKDYFNDVLMKGLKNVVNVDEKFIILNDELALIGYGRSCNPEEGEEYKESYKIMDALFRINKRRKREIILLSHNVPYNCSLDIVKWKGNPRDGEHVGSKVVKKMIQMFKPLYAIGGHMHEHFGACKIGKTTVINAGMGKTNVWLDLENKKKNIEFYKGKK
jgi:Icc-related predicted phosphoesterase